MDTPTTATLIPMTPEAAETARHIAKALEAAPRVFPMMPRTPEEAALAHIEVVEIQFIDPPQG